MLRKAPTFTIVAIATIALGTGASTALFSAADWLLMQPLAISRPDEVVTITGANVSNPYTSVSYPDYRDLRDQSRTLTDVVAYSLTRVGFRPSLEEPAQVAYGWLVSSNLFQALGVIPAVGRAFGPTDDSVPGRNAELVLGHRFWKSRFGGDAAAIGRRVLVNGVSLTIVGVAPERFVGLNPYLDGAVFVPIGMSRQIYANAGGWPENRDALDFEVKGRLSARVTLAQARADVDAIGRRLAQAYPSASNDHVFAVRTESQQRLTRDPEGAALAGLLTALVALLLVACCLNVANLLLGRARSRVREMAIRLALGARPSRLVRQLLVESTLLGAAGSVAGLWLAWALTIVLNGVPFPTDVPLATVRLSGRTLAIALAVGGISVLAFGLAPALRSARPDLVPALKSGELAESARRRWIGRHVLVSFQVAISIVILVVNAILFRGFAEGVSSGAGFRTTHLMTMRFDPNLIRYTPQQADQFYQTLAERARRVPGVKAVATAALTPMAASQRSHVLHIALEGPGRPGERRGAAILTNVVDEHFFDVMHIPIVRGRGFRESDTVGTPDVVVVNEAMAQHYWPGQDAIGKRLRQLDGSVGEVVGVARNAKYQALVEVATDYVYQPVRQRPWYTTRTLLAESTGESAAIAAPLREMVRQMDPVMPILEARTMEDFFQRGVLGLRRAVLGIVGAMGLVALALATIGVYGVVDYAVTCRMREFGIRIATGATAGDVLRMVTFDGVKLALQGITVGIAATVPIVAALRSFLFIGGGTWPACIVSSLLVGAVASIASWGPARRAARVDPIVALREE